MNLVRRWLRSARVQRTLALSALVVALGGLILLRLSSVSTDMIGMGSLEGPTGPHVGRFAGPGASGLLALSHTAVHAGADQRVYAELRMRATESASEAAERAPLALAIVLDTSGSMGGPKLERAKEAVADLIRGMEPSDQVAIVRYNGRPTLVRSLVQVGESRSSLLEEISELGSGGGTNIPPALAMGLVALEEASPGRVKRVVLVSDGLDGGRSRAEQLVRQAARSDVTVSSLGIGTDFDERYMAAVAREGRGNFAFVENAWALAGFLNKELKETARTSIRSATARIELPKGFRLVRAIGARAETSSEAGHLTLDLGSLFEGDERRVVLELTGQAAAGNTLEVTSSVQWRDVDGETHRATVPTLAMRGTTSPAEVEEGRDPGVYATCMSAVASVRQMDAAEAYRKGDTAEAYALIEMNTAMLDDVAAKAPKGLRAELDKQNLSYRDDLNRYQSARPKSPAGRAAAKRSSARDFGNLQRKAY